MPHTSSVRGITKTEGNQSPSIQLSGQTIQYLGRFYNLQSGDKLDHLFPGNWEIGITFLMIILQRDGSQVLEETFLCCETGQRLI